MQDKSNPVRRALGQPLAGGAVVESLETRRLLSAALIKNVAKGAAKSFDPGITYRPATDKTPTNAGNGKAVVKSAGKQSGAYTNYLQLLPKNVAKPSNVGATGPVGLTPAQVRAAYGMDTASFNGIVGDGAGQTIAIVDAYDHPGFVSSSDANFINSDLYKFADQTGLLAQYGLPNFTKLDQTGGTNYPSANSGWAGEIALDVEWAYAMAPRANIVLVEANSNSFTDLIAGAVNTARNLPNVSVVSMSFGADASFAGETYFDQFFATPAGHTGVTFLASSGDHGAVTPAGGTTGSATYPAESTNVVAVGGTNLITNGNAYGSETGWAGTGGGISNFQTKPAYQYGLTQSGTYRMTPDVSILGDPSTGVAVYDSYNNSDPGGGGWNNYLVGGTSLSAPLWAGVMGVVNQGRANIGLGSLGTTQALTRVYQAPASTLHDITSGNNGYSAGPGYDLVSGRGTPVGNSTLVSLAGGQYSGITYADRNANNAYDAGIDTPLSGVTVFNDTNNNTSLDGNESSATSNASGVWTIDVAAGITLNVRQFTPSGYARLTNSQLTGSGTTAYGTFTLGNFGYAQTVYTLPAGNNTVRVRADAGKNNLQIFVNTPTTAAATYTIKRSASSTVTINGNTADDAFILDLSNGSPFTNSAATLTFNGGTQTTADTYEVVGAASGSSYTFGPTDTFTTGLKVPLIGVEQRTYTGSAAAEIVVLSGITVANTPTINFNGGNDTLNVAGGTYQPAVDLGAGGANNVSLNATAGAAVTFKTSQNLASLSLAASTATLAAGGLVLRTSNLTLDGTSSLDLADGGMIYDYTTTSPAATVGALLASGYAANTWTGVGVRSSTAAADANKRHALGWGEAADVLRLSGTSTGTFLGQTVDATTILVRYTVRGDANLDGTTNFSDFLSLQTNFLQTGRSYAQGDFDYDGDTDFSDFLVLQTNFLQSV